MIFKATKILYFAAIALLLALIAWLEFDNVTIALFVLVTAFALCLIVAGVFYQIYKIRQLNGILDEKCDPAEYRRALSALLEKKDVQRSPALYTRLRLDLSTGLIESGEYDAARDLLTELCGKLEGEKNALNTALCYNNLSALGLLQNDPDNAKKYMGLLYGMMNRFKPGHRYRGLIETAYTVKQTQLEMAAGDYDNAERVFLGMFKNAKNMRMQVTAKYYLGKLYMNFNALDQAEDAFDFAACNGNKLYSAHLARKLLTGVRNRLKNV